MDEGSSRGGAVMARGGQHGDKRRLEEFLQSTEEWVNTDARALSDDAVTSESEMEESDKDDDKEFMEFMRREYPEVVTKGTSHGKYGTVVTMAHVKEDMVDGEGIDDQPNEVDMG
jgi:hypothetical protein